MDLNTKQISDYKKQGVFYFEKGCNLSAILTVKLYLAITAYSQNRKVTDATTFNLVDGNSTGSSAATVTTLTIFYSNL